MEKHSPGRSKENGIERKQGSLSDKVRPYIRHTALLRERITKKREIELDIERW